MISYHTSFITLVVSLHLEVMPLWGIVLRGNGNVLNRVLSAHSIYPVWMIWIVLWAFKWSIFLISKQCGFLFPPKHCLGAVWHEVPLCAKSVAQEWGVMHKHVLERNLCVSVVAWKYWKTYSSWRVQENKHKPAGLFLVYFQVFSSIFLVYFQ